MFYRLAADKCGDPAYPKISLTTLVQRLSLHGKKTLKITAKGPIPIEGTLKSHGAASKGQKKNSVSVENAPKPVELIAEPA